MIRRRFGIVLLAATALAALLDANGIASLVAAELTTSAGQLARAAPLLGPPAAPIAARVTSADAVLRRNPFDSVTGSLLGGDDPIGNVAVPAAELPTCDGYRPHIIVASDDPDWSFASLVGPSDSKPLLRRRGGSVGDREIAFVGIDRVWLRTANGTLCQAPLWRPPSSPPMPSSSSTPLDVTGKVRADAKALDPTIAKGIVKVGPRDYRIDRGVVDRIIEQYAELMKGTIVTPDKENGRTVGVRLNGIRPESVLGVLGLENGDRLMTINGFELTDPSAALQALGYIRTAPRLDVVIQRGGKPTSLVYNVE